MVRVCILGLGKTGKEIAKVLLEQEDMKIVSAICSPNSDKNGKDLGYIIGSDTTGIIIDNSDNLRDILYRTRPDVLVDFSNSEIALRNAKICSHMKVNLVMGTTGFSNINLNKFLILANTNKTGIIYAPNITLGINVLMLLSNLAANILNNYDFQITEIHHKLKKDIPSATAKKIAVEIEKGLLSSGNSCSDTQIPITAVRAGGVIGKHNVMIIGDDDKIEISHESFSRKAFAIGTLRAIRFLEGKTGYFEMSDVLNLRKVLDDYLEKEDLSITKRNLV